MGLNYLQFNEQMALTLVVDQTEEPYRAQIEFISSAEWEKELRPYFRIF